MLTDGGVTMVLDLDGGASFGFSDLSPDAASWGDRSISGFGIGAERFVANFSGLTVLGVQIDVSDYNADADDIYFRAYSVRTAPALSSVRTLTAFRAASAWMMDFTTLGFLGANAIGSVVFWGEGLNGDSNLYWDNLSAVTSRACARAGHASALRGGHCGYCRTSPSQEGVCLTAAHII